MPLVDELRNQISDDPWIPIEQYKKVPNYIDDESQCLIVGRSLSSIPGINYAGEVNSQYVTFHMDRFTDGIDKADKTIVIVYFRDNDASVYIDLPANVFYNNTSIVFSWIVPYNITHKAGNTNIGIYVHGKENNQPYVWKTSTTIYRVNSSYEVQNDTPLEPEPGWSEQVIKKLEELENMFAGKVDGYGISIDVENDTPYMTYTSNDEEGEI